MAGGVIAVGLVKYKRDDVCADDVSERVRHPDECSFREVVV